MLDKFGNAVIVQNAYSGARYKVFSTVCLGDAGVIILQDINAKENDGLMTVSPSEFVKVYFVVNHDRDGNEIKFERYNNETLPIKKIIKSPLSINSPSRFYYDADYRRKVLEREKRRRERRRKIKHITQKALKIICIILLIFVIICFSSCDKITQGEVYNKEYKPAENVITYIPMIHTNGKQSYTTLVPFYYHYPDRWRVDIRQSDGDGEEDIYNAIKIGDEFVYDENRDYDEEPYTREEVKE